jgi:UDP-N-acetylmuramoyl-tripeptide--D-alanyl-D-alanine ligase
MTIEELYRIYLKNPSVQTDTRKLKKDDIFFALRGDNFNGNSFAKKAIETGAAYAIIDDPAYEIPGKTILVDNVLITLQQLALHHRRGFTIPFIGITGSNGKTTTKELVHAVLSSSLKTYTTEGNLNNHIGIPLTLLKIRQDAEIAVIEMGANHQQEIAGYCTYAEPTMGIITNCGKAHLEGFGGVKGVRKGKGELFDYLRNNKGSAFVKYGTAEADIIGNVLKNDPFIEVNITKGADTGPIRTNLVGAYNLPNVLVAVAVGKHFGVPDSTIKKAIENYIPSNSRSQLLEQGTNKIILDAYNANPSSMKLAIENFAHLKTDNKILLLGAMAELGIESLQEHQDIIQLIQKYKWKAVLLVGGDFLKIENPFLTFASASEAKEWLKKEKPENSHLLIKGSRSMQMEKVLDF